MSRLVIGFLPIIIDGKETMDIKQVVGNNLKAARKAKGYTQSEVAKMLQKYQPDYSQYESGQIELDYSKIVFLCNLLDITPNDLFDIK